MITNCPKSNQGGKKGSLVDILQLRACVCVHACAMVPRALHFVGSEMMSASLVVYVGGVLQLDHRPVCWLEKGKKIRKPTQSHPTSTVAAEPVAAPALFYYPHYHSVAIASDDDNTTTKATRVYHRN